MGKAKRVITFMLSGILVFSDAVYASEMELPLPMDISDTTAKIGYHTVRFWAGSNLIVSQQIKDSSSAVAPEPPEEEGKYFTGWNSDFSCVTQDMDIHAVYAPMKEIAVSIQYLYEDGSIAAPPYIMTVKAGSTFEKTITSPGIQGYLPDKEQVIIQIPSETAGNIDNIEEIVTYKGAETAYTVRHMLENPDGKGYTEDENLREQKMGKAGSFTEAEARTIEGFSVKSKDRVKIAADGTTEVEIKYARNAYVLNWDCGGGTYIEPVYVKYGAAVEEPANPAKPGADFVGWSYTPALSDGTMPAANVTAKALWKDTEEADYTVVYWKEKMPGTYSGSETQYDYAESYISTGETGEEITYESRTYTGYELDTEKSGQSVRISSDGKAVKNVYYKRREYTIQFLKKEQSEWVPDKSLEITRTYGTDISEIWQDPQYAEYFWSKDKKLSETGAYDLLFSMPAANVSLYGIERGSGDSVIVYYTENIDGTWHLKQKLTLNSSFMGKPEGNNGQMEGFTLTKYLKNGQFKGMAQEDKDETYKGGWLQYTRNSYKLIFENCTGIEDVKLKYEAPLSDGKPNENNIMPVNAGDRTYVFDKWYTSPTMEPGTEVNWDLGMPAHDMRIYAGWKEVQDTKNCTVTFDLNGAPGNVPEAITVEKYTSVEDQMPEAPVWDDAHVFLGWYRDKECKIPFVENQQITKDYVLYAKWDQVPEYTYKIICKDIVTEKEITDGGTGKGAGYITVDAPSLEGYIPVTASQNVRIEKDGSEVIFYYRTPDTWELTVRYEDEEGNTIPGFDPEVLVVSEVEKVIFYKQIPGYKLLTEAAKTAVKGQKEVIFTYKKTAGVSYKIEHYIQNLSDDSYTLLEEEYKEGLLGWTVSAEAKEYEHFHCVSEKVDRTGIVSKNLVIKVYYDRDEYTVTFVDDDKTVLGTEKVRYEGSVRPLKAPEKEMDAKYKYTFSGWQGRYEQVVKDETVTAAYTREKRSYKVKYRIAGTILEEVEEHVWGETISIKESPKKDGYLFSGWTAQNVRVKENTFVMPAGEVIFTGYWEYVLEKPETPEKPVVPEEPKEKLPDAAVPESPESEKPNEDVKEPEETVLDEEEKEEAEVKTGEKSYTLMVLDTQGKEPQEELDAIDEEPPPKGTAEFESKEEPHVSCMRHFIFLLLGLILELAFVHDRKRHQQRIFALRRAIEAIDEDDR